MVRPTSVTPLDGFRLKLVYTDGVEGMIDLSKNVGRGVFAPLAKPEFFCKVRLGDHGQIAWNDEIELCPDSAYLEITGRMPMAARHA